MSEKRSRMGRIGRWGLAKFRNEASRDASRRVFRGGIDVLKDGLKPQALDMADASQGLKGRYADGGASRFREMAKELGLDRKAIRKLHHEHASHARINFMIAAGMLVISLMAIIQNIALSLGLILLLFTCVFMAMALRHDYAAWQTKIERFAGLREYLAMRLGRENAR